MSSALMRGSLNISASADTAQITVDIGRQRQRRIVDRDEELLLECLAAAYRSYHLSDDVWTRDSRTGERRLRLVGQLGTAAVPKKHFISVDLEDFQ